MRVPPPSATSEEKATFVNRLRQQSIDDQVRCAFELDAQQGLDMYLGSHWSEAGNDRTQINSDGTTTTIKPAAVSNISGFVKLTYNRVQNVCIAIHATQRIEPTKISFTGRESGEPPLYFLNTALDHPQVAAEAKNIDAAAPDDGSGIPGSARPLEGPNLVIIRRLVEQGRMALAASGGTLDAHDSSIFPEDALVEVNDHTAAEALQIVFDAGWDQCAGEVVKNEAVLNKTVIGVQPVLYEIDPVLKEHKLTLPHAKHVFFDPTGRKQYRIMDQPLTREEALAHAARCYPGNAQLREAIEDYSYSNTIKFEGQYTPAAMYEQQFQQDIVPITTCWLANSPYPMDVAEALERGLVSSVDLPDGDAIVAGHDEMGQPQLEQPTRRAFMSVPGAGELPREIKIGGAGWPITYGVRQLIVIANECVADDQCQYDRFPLTNLRNIPIPYSEYAQGEPKRLVGLQMAINWLMSCAVTWQRFRTFPPEVRPQSVADELGDVMRKIRTRPDGVLNVPDELIQQLGGIEKICGYLENGDLPPDFWRLLEFLIASLDKEGNQADVQQGESPAGRSGQAIAFLQNAAGTVIRDRNVATEEWIKDLVALFVQSITQVMTPADCARICSKYPIAIWQAFHQRLKKLHIDIKVQTPAGSGAAEQMQTNTILAARNGPNPLPISEATGLEKLGLDPDEELTKQAKFTRRRAEIAGSLGPAQPQQPQPQSPEQQSPPPAAQTGPALPQPQIASNNVPTTGP